MTDFEKQIQFIIEIDKAKHIFRQTYLADGSRKENDAEHSWHLAVMAMLFAPQFHVDPLKTTKMVLIHDLVEIDAGDTYCYDSAAAEGKEQREEAAAQRLFSMLPPAQKEEFYALWREFEERSTPEAVFAAVLDRIQPMLLTITEGGTSWKEHGVRAEDIRKRNEITFTQENEFAHLAQVIISQAAEQGLLQ